MEGTELVPRAGWECFRTGTYTSKGLGLRRCGGWDLAVTLERWLGDIRTQQEKDSMAGQRL